MENKAGCLQTFCPVDIVRAFSSAGVHLKDPCALVYACENDDVNVIKMLLDAGADPNHDAKHSSDGMMLPWSNACRYGNLAIVNALFDAGAQVNAECANMDTFRERQHETPLFNALNLWKLEDMSPDRLAIIDLLFEKRAYVTRVNYKWDTSLHLASRLGLKDVVQKLFDLGVETDFDKYTKCPLSAACSHGHFDVVEVLLSRLVRERVSDLNEGISKAIEHAHLNIVELLLKSGVEVNNCEDNEQYKTPLLLAIESHKKYGEQSMPMIHALLAASANINTFSSPYKGVSN